MLPGRVFIFGNSENCPPNPLTRVQTGGTLTLISSPPLGLGFVQDSRGGRTLFMRTIVFIDGQNLYHRAKAAWFDTVSVEPNPYELPSYDVEKLAAALVSRVPGRVLSEIRFYTGVPGRNRKFWHNFWISKLRHLQNCGIYTYRGRLNSGGQEKGVDVSLALDLVQATHEQRYEVAIIVSQDSDFGPAVRLSKEISAAQHRKLTFESAFPFNPSMQSRGVPGTTPVRIDQAVYDACFDARDYRSK